MIDVALAGDNAVVVGMAVAGLPAERRRMAILLGLGFATLLRVALGAVALRLLAIIGLTLAGGLLLLWVCWRMLSELRMAPRTHRGGGRGAWPSMGAGVRTVSLGRVDGRGGDGYRAAAGPVSLDRLGRVADRA